MDELIGFARQRYLSFFFYSIYQPTYLTAAAASLGAPLGLSFEISFLSVYLSTYLSIYLLCTMYVSIFSDES